MVWDPKKIILDTASGCIGETRVDISPKTVEETQNAFYDPDTGGRCSADFEVHENWVSSSLVKRLGQEDRERERERERKRDALNLCTKECFERSHSPGWTFIWEKEATFTKSFWLSVRNVLSF
jgi:hypothetical protein